MRWPWQNGGWLSWRNSDGSLRERSGTYRIKSGVKRGGLEPLIREARESDLIAEIVEKDREGVCIGDTVR